MGRPPIGKLRKPSYVLEMGWHRMSDTAKARWLHEMLASMDEARTDIETELAALEGP